MTIKWFHRHTFDSSKWKIEEKLDVYERLSETQTFLYTVGHKSTKPEKKLIGVISIHSNTCLGCGDLVFKEARLEV